MDTLHLYLDTTLIFGHFTLVFGHFTIIFRHLTLVFRNVTLIFESITLLFGNFTLIFEDFTLISRTNMLFRLSQACILSYVQTNTLTFVGSFIVKTGHKNSTHPIRLTSGFVCRTFEHIIICHAFSCFYHKVCYTGHVEILKMFIL